MLHGIELEAVCKTSDVLATLRNNRAIHADLVKEAREGYIEKAKKELEHKLGQLREGKYVAVAVALKLPEDHTSDYDTVIGMLECHREENIKLSAYEYRTLMENKWGWISSWKASNSSYSPGTAAYPDDE